MNNQKAIIIGASSGIGKELAKILAKNGYEVGLCARRLPLLEELQKEISAKTYIKQIDVSQDLAALQTFEELIAEMENVDLIILCAGVGYINPELMWNKEKHTIETNVIGFTALALKAFKYFCDKNSGHLVGISSIAALRGMGDAPTYSASKAFVSNLMQGLYYRIKRSGKNVYTTDIQPGFVDTDMAKGEGIFWLASPEKAAKQIYDAVRKKKKHAYITRKWRMMAWLMKVLPDWMYCKI